MAQGSGYNPSWMTTATQVAQGHGNWNEQFGWNKGYISYDAFGINQFLGGGGGGGALSLSEFGLSEVNFMQLSLINNMLAGTGISFKSENGQLNINISWMEGEQINYRDDKGYTHTVTLQTFAFKNVILGGGVSDIKPNGINKPIIPGIYDNSWDNIGYNVRNLERRLDGRYNGTGMPPLLLRIAFDFFPIVSVPNSAKKIISGTDLYNRNSRNLFDRYVLGLFGTLGPFIAPLSGGTFIYQQLLILDKANMINNEFEPYY